MADLTPEQRLDRLERATAQLAVAALGVQRADAARAKLNPSFHPQLLELLHHYQATAETFGKASVTSLGQTAAGAEDDSAEAVARMRQEAREFYGEQDAERPRDA
jgi:hypothetical protein